MKLITEVKIIDVPRDPSYLINTPSPSASDQILHEEIIWGRRFSRTKKFGAGKTETEEYVIGATADVNDILWIYQNGWEELEKSRDDYKERYQKIIKHLDIVTKELGDYKNMGLWQRLKFILMI